MQNHYFQYDYAEMQGEKIKALGILFYQDPKTVVSVENLIQHTRKLLNKPGADFFISGVAHIDKKTYDELAESWQQKN